VLVSILICSRNRCESLKETLVALRRLEIPSGIKVEAVLVDNGSTDGAGELMRGFLWPGASVVFAEEARPGKGHSLNTAIAAS